MALKHFVLTRIGLGIYSEIWFEQMVSLFLAVTASSLARQTSQDFHWLIVVDSALPPGPRGQLEAFLAEHPNFHLVTIDVTKIMSMKLGSHDWMYEPCLDFIFANRLVEDPCEYVVTSAIDGDDAWANDYVESVTKYLSSQLPALEGSEKKRGSHLQHSNGMMLTYTQGMTWFLNNDELAIMPMAYHSMSISLLARLSAGLSSLSARHAAWSSAAKVADFTTREMPGTHPMWLYVRHDLTDLGWTAQPTTVPAEKVADALEKAFGIDMAKVNAWRAKYVKAGKMRHGGSNAGEQYSRLQHLATLNRQIAALESGGKDSASVEFLARQRAAREKLLDAIYSEGRKN